MNPEVKAKWVAALRSGDYEQGTGALCYQTEDLGDQFCCLGVLCEIAVHEGVIPPAVLSAASGSKSYSGLRGALPQDVVEWAGLDRSDPEVVAGRLSTINDSGGKFSFIADLIEDQL